MSRLAKVHARAAARADGASRRLADHLRERLPGVTAEPVPGGVAIAGPRLRWRAVTDPAVRDLASTFRRDA